MKRLGQFIKGDVPLLLEIDLRLDNGLEEDQWPIKRNPSKTFAGQEKVVVRRICDDREKYRCKLIDAGGKEAIVDETPTKVRSEVMMMEDE